MPNGLTLYWENSSVSDYWRSRSISDLEGKAKILDCCKKKCLWRKLSKGDRVLANSKMKPTGVGERTTQVDHIAKLGLVSNMLKHLHVWVSVLKRCLTQQHQATGIPRRDSSTQYDTITNTSWASNLHIWPADGTAPQSGLGTITRHERPEENSATWETAY